ncbi:hypothetical protein CEUSTIGMA_g11702.t1 [Chlamydomonas eustigma]|uniref:GH16 domain-containing protein n=1 Tax=Chlamydomonas eustigma TaxID=1157962 RepID=A0A250XN95_9CHLO|nr:hypothetical protein CEUSTIGMA_g11702.t1 [Chlamydomonas eustigma]|eukprot:GAX84280.1 hypothetical protein CEUSTIGMA_g11702.t1 [Chlamydomonas eustigma]
MVFIFYSLFVTAALLQNFVSASDDISPVTLCSSLTPCPINNIYYYCTSGLAINGCQVITTGPFILSACTSQCLTAGTTTSGSSFSSLPSSPPTALPPVSLNTPLQGASSKIITPPTMKSSPSPPSSTPNKPVPSPPYPSPPLPKPNPPPSFLAIPILSPPPPPPPLNASKNPSSFLYVSPPPPPPLKTSSPSSFLNLSPPPPPPSRAASSSSPPLPSLSHSSPSKLHPSSHPMSPPSPLPPAPTTLSAVSPPLQNLTLNWNDEFDLGGLDLDTWSYQYGDGSAYGIPGWGNGELECYTNSSSNLAIIQDPTSPSNGLLSITALHQPNYNCYNLQAPESFMTWTSAKITTSTSKAFQWLPDGTPLYIEARIQVPVSMGTWPAFWMLPVPNAFGGWCASGEIDIMEHVNNNSLFYGTLHFGGLSGGGGGLNCQSDGGNVDVGEGNAGAWHVFAVVWSSKYISFLADGVEYYRDVSSHWWSGSAPQQSGAAPFNEPFYLILNLAIGGQWPGYVMDLAPKTMLVDWIRVWNMNGYT